MEKALLVGIILGKENKKDIYDQLIELEQLANTAGANSLSTVFQHRKKPDPATYIGKGKLATILNQAKALNCSLIIFNNDISPSQIKNIQKEAGEFMKVMDRTGLILDIFTKHAKTKEAKTQVELAHLEYLLPRLTRQWTHLERQMGGIGTRAGAGETQIEVDRRLIRNHIIRLKKELKKIEKQRFVQNQTRKSAYTIALVGYTNAGKSSIMRMLTGSDIFIEDKLFATLDTTTRKLDLNSGQNVIISDTVGFIRNLPFHLVASFRSTLGEIQNVDLLIKVFDASSENLQIHIDTVNNVLHDLKLSSKSSLLLFNKIDLIKDSHELEGLKNRYSNCYFTSAITKGEEKKLINKIKDIATSEFVNETFQISYKQSKILDTIYALSHVLKKKEDYNGIKLEVEGNKESIEKIRNIINQ